MGKSKQKKGSFVDRLFDLAGALVPSCNEALRLAEEGRERRLSVREKFVLTYNSPLCPHCQCNREKFDRARKEMRARQRERKRGGG